jgi:ornithine cyclodeaminase/alanine dehydrogenase-like protein (mu-crystallin family)
MIWISDHDVATILKSAGVIKVVELVEAGLTEVTSGSLIEAPVTRLNAAEHTANYTIFPAYSRERALTTVKVLSGVERNPENGAPMIDAVIIAIDAMSGAILAVMDGRRITAMRTAATTAIALHRLIPETARSLGIIGTGVQGRAHAQVLSAAIPDLHLSIASANGDTNRARVLADETSTELGRQIGTSTCDEIAEGADAIIVASLAKAPLVGLSTKPDVVIASVGHFVPGATEIDPSLVATATVIVSDHPERFRRQWRAHSSILGDALDRLTSLEALVASQAIPSGSGRSIFLSDGRSFEDCVVAGYVLQQAEQQGIGTRLRDTR